MRQGLGVVGGGVPLQQVHPADDTQAAPAGSGNTERVASRVEVAEAFSAHRFGAATPALAEGVVWVQHGGTTIEGREAVVAACDETDAALAATPTRFRSFRSVDGGSTVVVDAVGEYVESDGAASAVASCDLYDFDGDAVVRITSYTVEVPPAP